MRGLILPTATIYLMPVLLLFSSFVGGCAGSTAGGMKVVRALLLYRQGVSPSTSSTSFASGGSYFLSSSRMFTWLCKSSFWRFRSSSGGVVTSFSCRASD